jgi:pimeloyl-ACP methyl ester carboxylesterase
MSLTNENIQKNNLFPHFKKLLKQNEYFEKYNLMLEQFWPVHYQERTIKTQYGLTYLIICGEDNAPPLFLLHNSSSNSLIWYQIVKKLSKNFKLYCLDILGDIGKSIPTNPPKTEEQLADWIEQVMLANNIHQAFFIGLSYGGFACLNFALHKQERVKKLILLAPASTILSLSIRFWYLTMLNLLFPSKKHTDKLIQVFTFKKTYTNQYLDEMKYFIFKYGKFTYKVHPRKFSNIELKSLNVPTLFLVGQQEIIYKPEKAIKRAMDFIPNCRVGIIPECGHSIPTDQPELLASRITNYLC